MFELWNLSILDLVTTHRKICIVTWNRSELKKSAWLKKCGQLGTYRSVRLKNRIYVISLEKKKYIWWTPKGLFIISAEWTIIWIENTFCIFFLTFWCICYNMYVLKVRKILFKFLDLHLYCFLFFLLTDCIEEGVKEDGERRAETRAALTFSEGRREGRVEGEGVREEGRKEGDVVREEEMKEVIKQQQGALDHLENTFKQR